MKKFLYCGNEYSITALAEQVGLSRANVSKRLQSSKVVPGDDVTDLFSIKDKRTLTKKPFFIEDLPEGLLSQRDYLYALKTASGLKWDDLAAQSGISVRQMKRYTLPETSSEHMVLPKTAYFSLDALKNKLLSKPLSLKL
jgi:hypothetical protein